MQIREQGRRYQLLRGVYVPAHDGPDGTRIGGKTRLEMVASFPTIDADDPGPEVFAKLDQAEADQLREWIDQRKQEKVERDRDFRRRWTLRDLAEIATDIEGHNIDQEWIDQAKAAMSDVLAAWRRQKKKGS